MKKYERLLKALANARRLEIVKYLKKEKRATVGDIASHIKLSFRSTSKHLAVLFASDIVTREQRSLNILYSLHHSPARIIRAIISLV